MRQAEEILQLAGTLDLWHTPRGEAFATFLDGGHSENWPIRSKQFRHWLSQTYYAKTKHVPSSTDLEEALGTLEGRARFEGKEHDAFLRVAQFDAKIYIDLADERWRVVEVSASGWQILDDSPVLFRRSTSTRSLPEPKRGGDIELLRRYVNCATQDDFLLIVAWALASFRPCGPYPILVLQGEQGSAKSTTAKVLRSLIDPSAALVRSAPGNDRDLMVAASNAWVLSFDNVSNIRPQISDALCRLATGSGFGTRKLYTDDDENLIQASRPVILNGIEDLVTRPDLRDRSVVIEVPRIPPDRRCSEAQLWQDFERDRPSILGALFDALSGALRNVPDVKLAAPPRMVDFAIWGTAAEAPLGWPQGAFLNAYERNIAFGVGDALDSSPIARLICVFAEKRWRGTASQLLDDLNRVTSDKQHALPGWPVDATRLSNALRRLAPVLRESGVEIEFIREGSSKRERIITICRIDSPVVSQTDADGHYADNERPIMRIAAG